MTNAKFPLLQSEKMSNDPDYFKHYSFDHTPLLAEHGRDLEGPWDNADQMPHYLAVIPASRGATALRPLLTSLVRTELPLTVFVAHSDRQAQTATTTLLERTGLDYVNAYIPPGQHTGSFGFQADTFPLAIEGRQDNNLAFKRNIGLLLCGALKCCGMLAVDDGIDITHPFGLGRVLERLSQSNYNLVGMNNSGMPDRSVVHHALGLRTSPFISGQAFAVHALSAFGGTPMFGPDALHFPNVYNEDWLYMREAVRLGVAARAGRIRQQSYDPFVTQRSCGEEFGDTIAEGLYSLKHRSYDDEFWKHFILERRAVIGLAEAIIEADVAIDEAERARRLQALTQARLASLAIDAADCAHYERVWVKDKKVWDSISQKSERSLRWTSAPKSVKRLFAHMELPPPDYRIGVVAPNRRHERIRLKEYMKLFTDD